MQPRRCRRKRPGLVGCGPERCASRWRRRRSPRRLAGRACQSPERRTLPGPNGGLGLRNGAAGPGSRAPPRWRGGGRGAWAGTDSPATSLRRRQTRWGRLLSNRAWPSPHRCVRAPWWTRLLGSAMRWLQSRRPRQRPIRPRRGPTGSGRSAGKDCRLGIYRWCPQFIPPPKRTITVDSDKHLNQIRRVNRNGCGRSRSAGRRRGSPRKAIKNAVNGPAPKG